MSGHAHRLADLDLFAALGVRALRYPVLWERVAPDGLRSARWSWPDQRLARLRELGIRPIVGLLHHGSGPRDTSLLDSAFPERLAQYARAVAERYPWVQDWSPVNEPLTTARFSALYGHWYPHARDLPSFVRALLNQCRGIALCMREIRRVNPRAKLVLPEELGRIRSCARLAYQARYENRRRLLGLDLLTGRVWPDHPLWRHLLGAGSRRSELETFLAYPCPPDLIGVNYYLTSDRFLDDALERHPPHTHGGNGRDRYADVEAVRIPEIGITGHQALLRELWERYHIPVALTEVHAGCTREEQLRWLVEAWRGACAARSAGADVRAVTAWSLLGAFDWDKLVTRVDGYYEPGVFDLRSSAPRPTALARTLRELAQSGDCAHPVLHTPGWWHRSARICAGTSGAAAHEPAPSPASALAGTPILVLGATGTLGRALARVAAERGLCCRFPSRSELDITDLHAIERGLDRLEPWAIVNAAGYARVDDAERESARCWLENVTGAAQLAAAARARELPLVTFSSDLVFSGETDRPYVESDPPAPLSTYGLAKAEAERRVLELAPHALVIRSAGLFGPCEQRSFVQRTLAALRAGRPVQAVRDLVLSPTYVPDLAHAAFDLLVDGERGLWHVVNRGAVSWAELAARLALGVGADPGLIQPCSSTALRGAAPRPRFSCLESERGLLLRTLECALDGLLCDLDAMPISRPMA